MADARFFDSASAARIAAAVRKVEIGDRAERPLRFDSIPPPSGGTKVKFAIWTATTVWSVAAITGATTTSNTKVVQFAFPTATQVVGTAVFSVSAGATAMCVNHLAFLPVITTNVTNANQTILIAKEAGMWRLIGAQA